SRRVSDRSDDGWQTSLAAGARFIPRRASAPDSRELARGSCRELLEMGGLLAHLLGFVREVLVAVLRRVDGPGILCRWASYVLATAVPLGLLRLRLLLECLLAVTEIGSQRLVVMLRMRITHHRLQLAAAVVG